MTQPDPLREALDDLLLAEVERMRSHRQLPSYSWAEGLRSRIIDALSPVLGEARREMRYRCAAAAREYAGNICAERILAIPDEPSTTG